MAKGPTISTTFNAIDRVSRPMQKMAKNVGRIAKVAGTAVAVGLGAGIAFAVREASKIEDITASFAPMLGGFEKANELVAMLNQTAATTPFQLNDIANAATQLLPAMNGDLKNTVETFRMLGDTAGGNVEKLNRISSVYSRVLLKNKLETGDLNILTERGIPIYKELSESMGISVAEMAKMATQGKITGADLTKAFQNMTSEGGVFFKGMEIASATLTGRFSTLKDNIALTAAGIGKTLLPVLKKYLDIGIQAAASIRNWVEVNQMFIKLRIENTIIKITETIKTLVKLWDSGLIQALIAGIATFQILLPLITSIVGIIKVWQGAQLSINLLLAANPIGLWVTAIAAVIAGIVWIIKNKDKIGEAMGKASPEEREQQSGRVTRGRTRGQLGDEATQTRGSNRGRGLVGRNDGTIQRTESNSNTTVDVNFNNTPENTSFSQRGQAPGISVNTGFGRARL